MTRHLFGRQAGLEECRDLPQAGTHRGRLVVGDVAEDRGHVAAQKLDQLGHAVNGQDGAQRLGSPAGAL